MGERETRIALLEEGKLVELHIERAERVVGSLYKCRVANVLPGMDAAFVDINLERNAFLYVGDVLVAGDDAGSVDMAPPSASAPSAPKSAPGTPAVPGGPAASSGGAETPRRNNRRPRPYAHEERSEERPQTAPLSLAVPETTTTQGQDADAPAPQSATELPTPTPDSETATHIATHTAAFAEDSTASQREGAEGAQTDTTSDNGLSAPELDNSPLTATPVAAEAQTLPSESPEVEQPQPDVELTGSAQTLDAEETSDSTAVVTQSDAETTSADTLPIVVATDTNAFAEAADTNVAAEAADTSVAAEAADAELPVGEATGNSTLR